MSINDGRIGKYYDSEKFKQNKLFNSLEKSKQIMLYHDDFNVVIPLGNKASKYKKPAFYFVIGNVPNQFRSRLRDSNLLIFITCIITKYGYKEILQPCFDDLKKSEATGISVKFENSKNLFEGSIPMVIADNLAAHALGGFFCSFSMVNRVYNCSKEQRERNASLAEMQLRTLEACNNSIRIVEADNSFASVYSIKERSCLNDLEYLHVINSAPPDLAHNVFEGIAVNFISDTVGYFCKEKNIRLEEINHKIYLFKFSELDERNKLQLLRIFSTTTFKIKQTACEMCCLLRTFLLIIGSAIPTENSVWELYMLFVHLLEGLCAPSFNNEEMSVLYYLIK